MKRERVSDDIVVFTSTLYAQVNAGAVLTPAGAVLIDTLPFPEETREIADYLESEGARGVVRYVVNTHRHGDHTHGNYLFPHADIIGLRDETVPEGTNPLLVPVMSGGRRTHRERRACPLVA